MFKVEGNYMKKQKIIKVGFIAKKAGALILTLPKIRKELEGQREWLTVLNNFCNLSLCMTPLSKSIAEGCTLSLNLKPYTMFLSGLASHG